MGWDGKSLDEARTDLQRVQNELEAINRLVVGQTAFKLATLEMKDNIDEIMAYYQKKAEDQSKWGTFQYGITMNEKDEKRLCTMEKILVPTVFDPSITFSIYKFKPTFIENPTKTSIQFENKHFEDDIGRYINHNCDPNTKIIKLAKTDDIVLIPIKDIAINEEITINYNATEEKLSHPFKCDCHGKLIKGNKYGQNKRTCSRKEKD